MFPSLIPPGKSTPRRGTPALPSLAIPKLSPSLPTDFKSSLSARRPSNENGGSLLTPAMADMQVSASSQLSASELFNADVRRVLGSDSSEQLERTIRPPPKTLLDMHEDDWRLAFDNGQVRQLSRIGEGNGGSVYRCQLAKMPELGVFALKTIPADPDPQIQRQILRELSFNRSCQSPYIAQYYGAYLNEKEGVICIAMEFCEGGSLDAVYKRVKQRNGRTGERVVGRVARGVLEGLSYLHQRRIIHRDIKPSNILLTKDGQVKLCDFGVSGELVNSLAGTFTGTSYYMAPERIQGQPYTVSSDVWSLGLTLMEVCSNKFPFLESDTCPLMPIELLNVIVTQEPPVLLDEPEIGVKWSNSFRHFLKCCLERDRLLRLSPREMLEHPWIVGISLKKVDMERWIEEVWN